MHPKDSSYPGSVRLFVFSQLGNFMMCSRFLHSSNGIVKNISAGVSGLKQPCEGKLSHFNPLFLVAPPAGLAVSVRGQWVVLTDVT